MPDMKEERRSELRVLCADMVEVRWRDRAGKLHTATALLEDIAGSGACLQLEAPLPVGVEIAWDSPKQTFTGQVRYCVYREIGYFAGVEFRESTRWSRKNYLPQHLLDLERLAAKTKDDFAEEPDEVPIVRSRRRE